MSSFDEGLCRAGLFAPESLFSTVGVFHGAHGRIHHMPVAGFRRTSGHPPEMCIRDSVLSDAYNPKTKIPLKILVNRFMMSAYSFKRVTIVIIKTTSRRMQTVSYTHLLLIKCHVIPPLSVFLKLIWPHLSV